MSDFRNDALEDSIRAAYKPLVFKFAGKDIAFPFKFFERHEMGGFHLEYDSHGKISLISTDRNLETSRKSSTRIDDIMYWIFVGYAESKARRDAVSETPDNIDPRRIWFKLATKYMGELTPEWGHRLEKEYSLLLEKNPFIDT